MHGGRILKTAQGVGHMVQAVKILPATDEIWTNQLRSSFASSHLPQTQQIPSFKKGTNTPERKDYLMEHLLVAVEP